MNELQVFNSEQFGDVRVVMKDNEPWFVAADVCRVLEIGNSRMATSRLDDDEKAAVSLTDTSSNGVTQTRDMAIVNEPGLYSLVLGSRKPQAKSFKRWITHDVIPTIRKTGGYVNDDSLFISTYLPYADESTCMLFRSTLATIRNLNARIEADKPLVEFANDVGDSDDCISMGALAKLLKQNGVDIGRTRLFKWMRDNGYLNTFGEEHNVPSQYAMERGLFRIKEGVVYCKDGSVALTKTPIVTSRGQKYFLERKQRFQSA